jgi:hypothetical protein
MPALPTFSAAEVCWKTCSLIASFAISPNVKVFPALHCLMQRAGFGTICGKRNLQKISELIMGLANGEKFARKKLRTVLAQQAEVQRTAFSWLRKVRSLADSVLEHLCFAEAAKGV